MKRSLPAHWTQPFQQARSAWAHVPAKRRRWLVPAALLVLLVCIWQWSLAPSLATWRASAAQHSRLDAQWQAMQLHVQALQTLQNLPRPDPARATEALAQSLKPLGTQARLNVEGGRATVSLQGLPPEALAAWLSTVRTNTQAVPLEAELQRQPGAALWDGRVVLVVPAP